MLLILKCLQTRLCKLDTVDYNTTQDEHMLMLMLNENYYFYNSFKELLNEVEFLYRGQVLFQDPTIYLLDFVASISKIGDLFVKVLLCRINTELQIINFADFICLRQKETIQELNLFISSYFDYVVIDHDHWTGEVLDWLINFAIFNTVE